MGKCELFRFFAYLLATPQISQKSGKFMYNLLMHYTRVCDNSDLVQHSVLLGALLDLLLGIYLALCIAPFLFNPHQFSFTDFIVDYW
jgi:hypothetical protein